MMTENTKEDFAMIKKMTVFALVCAMIITMMTGCATGASGSGSAGTSDSSPKDATRFTAEKNQSWYGALDFDDESEMENAKKGLIEAPESLTIKDEQGNTVWSVDDYDFMESFDKAPDTANPSLWRNTLLNTYAGLFEVCEGIYQVRGYDMANATFIKTDNGWIVFDVLMCREDMAEAKALMEKHFGKLNVTAVMYSHSHIDHYGGIYGLIKKEDAADPSLSLEEQLASGKTVVMAPEGFMEHAVSENVYAGYAMGRRGQYQYGALLEPGEKGRLGIGIGLGQSLGSTGLLAPTYDVVKDETLKIDGVEVQFQLTPGTEAPAEMNAYFPDYKALWLAENCTGTMHNLYTLRGAQVRNADDWARYILEAEKKFGDKAEVVFQSHNWPHWGTDTIKEYMENTAAVYKFINDQTLHYINLGYTSAEISDMLTLPDELNKVWYTRQYYGTLSHNIKAVYQKNMGWYDANPVNLNLLPPEESAKKLVEYLGDTDAVLAKAREDFGKGEYQWVAQITKELVYADPDNKEARYLCADALEQLGYQAESGPWRNAYLTGALELREGNQSSRGKAMKGNAENRAEMSIPMMMDYVAISTDALKAQNDDLSLELTLTDTGEKYRIVRRSGVLLTYEGVSGDADCSISCTKLQFIMTLNGDREAAAEMSIEGDRSALQRLVKYMTEFTMDFNIAEP